MLCPYEIPGRAVGNTRTVWVLPPVVPPDGPPPLILLLDGEWYTSVVEAPQTLHRLQQEGHIPPAFCLFVSHVDMETRWRECPCSPEFAAFLAGELVPWATETFGLSPDPEDRLIGGLSFTGLAAAFTALSYPDTFRRVLCQSASFWWADEWLTRQAAGQPLRLLRFYVSCGEEETAAPVEHRPGVVQRRSQLESCRAMAEALAAGGSPVHFETFPGGHSFPGWAQDLPTGLRYLLTKP